MDEDRRIRFMVAPLLFLASLAWGFVRDPVVGLNNVLPGIELKLSDISGLIAAIVGGGLALFPLGFAIGTTTYVALRLLSQVSRLRRGGSGCHEIMLPADTVAAIWALIGVPGEPDRRLELFAGVTFDHETLRKGREGVHHWVMRRWNAFSIAVTSVTALLLSLGAGRLLGIPWRTDWHPYVLGLCAIFLVSAFFAWRDTMRMLTFQSRLPKPEVGGC